MAEHDDTCECAQCTLKREVRTFDERRELLRLATLDAARRAKVGKRLFRDQRTDVKRNHYNSVARAPVTGDARNGERQNGAPWRRPENFASILHREAVEELCTREHDFIHPCACDRCRPTAGSKRDKRADMLADKNRRKHP